LKYFLHYVFLFTIYSIALYTGYTRVYDVAYNIIMNKIKIQIYFFILLYYCRIILIEVNVINI